ILKGLVRQFNLPIVMVEAETERAEDGLALSSRNGYLSAAERAEAPRLFRLLREASDRVAGGERPFGEIEAAATADLTRHGWQVDYVSVRSRTTLLPPTLEESRFVILAAARLGHTRLIDNLEC
ncbi:MAG TPA: pantoate--beta-alanine ligase, partial [Thiobacillaceae bacterium]|nr:pantoate--beta-alanine ligase [Thiobacillaceae bacterium]